MRGSIQQRGPSSWRIRIDLDRVGGDRQRRFFTVRGTRKDAQRELARLLVAADTGSLPDATQVTIGAYLTNYLDNATGLSPKTLERYRELAARQIIPHLGDVKLQKLRPEHLEAWHAKLIAGGLAARTIGHAHRVLRLGAKARPREWRREPQRRGHTQAAAARGERDRDPYSRPDHRRPRGAPRSHAAPYRLARTCYRLAPWRAARVAMVRRRSRPRRASRRALARGDCGRPPAQVAQDETRAPIDHLAARGDRRAPRAQDPTNAA